MLFESKPMLYTEKEIAAVDAHIEKYFGTYETVFHEIPTVLDGIHCDIVIIPPSEKHNFITLITQGAGAYRMKLPKAYRKSHFDRAEYLITLPPDWDLRESALKDAKNYWPMEQLKNAARLPIWCDTWLGYAHTMSNDEANSPFADNTKLCSVILSFPEQFGDDSSSLCAYLPRGRKVAFWQLIPIYESELLLARKDGDNNAEELFELLGDIIKEPVNIARPSVA